MSENDALQVSCCGRHGIVGCERCFGPYRVVRPMVRRTELDELRAERDSLVASLEEANAEIRRLAANSRAASNWQWTIGERDDARAELSELRAMVEAAVTRCQRTISAWNTNHDAVSDFRCEEASDLLAILSPPEGP